ncbi:MAG: cobalt ECF transporter T component CbiQ [Angelakisella sp.]
MGQHRHVDLTCIDFYAQHSGLGQISPGLKCCSALLALTLVLAANSFLVSGFVVVSLCAVTVFLGKTSLKLYLRLMLIPLTFVLISGLALLLDYSPTVLGLLNLPFFNGYLCVTADSLFSTAHVTVNAVAAVSCLYTLSLSTPMGDIISVLRKGLVPEIFIELMYLIYRYIFVLSHTLAQLKIATASRLGFCDYKNSFRTIGKIMTRLLLRSFQKASASFDAMESRCYTGTLRFMGQSHPIRGTHLLAITLWLGTVILLFLIERVWP